MLLSLRSFLSIMLFCCFNQAFANESLQNTENEELSAESQENFAPAPIQCHYYNSDDQCRAVNLGDPCVKNGALGKCAASGSTGGVVNCACASFGPPIPPPPPAPKPCNWVNSAISCRGGVVGSSCFEMRLPGICFSKLDMGRDVECGCNVGL